MPGQEHNAEHFWHPMTGRIHDWHDHWIAGGFRSEYLFAVVLVVVPLSLSLWLLPLQGGYAYLILLPLVTVAAVFLGPGAGALATSASVAAADYFFLAPIHEFGIEPGQYPALSVYLLGCAVICYLAHRLRRAERQPATGLAARGRMRGAEERQRRQIAQDLHDDLGQTLAAARIRLGGLCNCPDDEVRREARKVSALVDQAVLSTRTMVRRLAPPSTGDLELAPALVQLVREMDHTFGLRISLQHDGHPTGLSPVTRTVLYRAARELLINAAKHSGAQAARIEVRRRARHVLLAVADGGNGFDQQAKGGLGLAIVRERMQSVGGRLRLRSRPGRGTLALLIAPLAPLPGADAE